MTKQPDPLRDLREQANFDIQTYELLEALDARNVHSAGDMERYDRQGLDIARLTVATHAWNCGANVKHGDKNRPHIGWICERGAKAIAAEYARLTEPKP